MRFRVPPLVNSAGSGKFYRQSTKIIRFVSKGCTNRPFYHIVVAEKKKHQFNEPIEQVGTFDPMPNAYNEKLVSFNFERVKHWLGCGAQLSNPVAELLGLSGYLPLHPRTYMYGWIKRPKLLAEMASKEEIKTT